MIVHLAEVSELMPTVTACALPDLTSTSYRDPAPRSPHRGRPAGHRARVHPEPQRSGEAVDEVSYYVIWTGGSAFVAEGDVVGSDQRLR